MNNDDLCRKALFTSFEQHKERLVSLGRLDDAFEAGFQAAWNMWAKQVVIDYSNGGSGGVGSVNFSSAGGGGSGRRNKPCIQAKDLMGEV